MEPKTLPSESTEQLVKKSPETLAKLEIEELKPEESFKTEESQSMKKKTAKRVDPKFNNFPLIEEGIELERKSMNLNNEAELTQNNFSKENVMQSSIRQKTDIEKWSNLFNSNF